MCELNIGRWRIRLRMHRRSYSALWYDRTCYSEGRVYRAALGLWQITVMVDAMTKAERLAKTNAMQEWLHG